MQVDINALMKGGGRGDDSMVG